MPWGSDDDGDSEEELLVVTEQPLLRKGAAGGGAGGADEAAAGGRAAAASRAASWPGLWLPRDGRRLLALVRFHLGIDACREFCQQCRATGRCPCTASPADNAPPPPLLDLDSSADSTDTLEARVWLCTQCDLPFYAWCERRPPRIPLLLWLILLSPFRGYGPCAFAQIGKLGRVVACPHHLGEQAGREYAERNTDASTAISMPATSQLAMRDELATTPPTPSSPSSPAPSSPSRANPRHTDANTAVCLPRGTAARVYRREYVLAVAAMVLASLAMLAVGIWLLSTDSYTDEWGYRRTNGLRRGFGYLLVIAEGMYLPVLLVVLFLAWHIAAPPWPSWRPWLGPPFAAVLCDDVANLRIFLTSRLASELSPSVHGPTRHINHTSLSGDTELPTPGPGDTAAGHDEEESGAAVGAGAGAAAGAAAASSLPPARPVDAAFDINNDGCQMDGLYRGCTLLQVAAHACAARSLALLGQYALAPAPDVNQAIRPQALNSRPPAACAAHAELGCAACHPFDAGPLAWQPPLFLAVLSKRMCASTIQALYNLGVDLNARYWHVPGGSFRQRLIGGAGPALARPPHDGMELSPTALHLAVLHDRGDALQTLLFLGADAELRWRAETPEMMAKRLGRQTLLPLLSRHRSGTLPPVHFAWRLPLYRSPRDRDPTLGLTLVESTENSQHGSRSGAQAEPNALRACCTHNLAVMVASVQPGSVAARAGIRAGDLLSSIRIYPGAGRRFLGHLRSQPAVSCNLATATVDDVWQKLDFANWQQSWRGAGSISLVVVRNLTR